METATSLIKEESNPPAFTGNAKQWLLFHGTECEYPIMLFYDLLINSLIFAS